jgi:hypothetical protein
VSTKSTTDGDDSERLSDLVDRLDRLSEADEGPDYGRLARIGNALHELEGTTGEETAIVIENAHEHVKEYRSGVPGV